ncbi:MAG: hypothetical protein EXR48_02470 [Dehalococcoidia bacterium]|nr:hypothetical protein [Dehalococcoidia bacterium]
MANKEEGQQPFRFFDNREKYLLFVTTCSEKRVVAERIAKEAERLQPAPPALRVFDAGMGDATVLMRVMRYLHARFPTVPFLVVAKEISEEDMRISLEKMADRFHEHPQTVLVLTNMFYSEAPSLQPRSEEAQAKLAWLDVPLKGDSAYQFDEQLKALEPTMRQMWRSVPNEKTGNLVYARPAVLVLYREDQRWPLGPVIPRKGDRDLVYDLVIVSQPYRARLPASAKVQNVLRPLALALAPGGRMVCIQSTGKDPGMEIIRKVWPDENPFQTPRWELLRELQAQMGDALPGLQYLDYPDEQAEFRYVLHMRPTEVNSKVNFSTLLAAWNAAVYVAQIEDERLQEAMGKPTYLQATQEVLERHKGLWFVDEQFVVARTRG